jgi:hypothetical protein
VVTSDIQVVEVAVVDLNIVSLMEEAHPGMPAARQD